jgi:hypothetical protein
MITEEQLLHCIMPMDPVPRTLETAVQDDGLKRKGEIAALFVMTDRGLGRGRKSGYNFN